MRRLLPLVLLAACGDDTGPPDARGFDGAPGGGRISLTWTIADLEGNALTCADVGAQFVSVTMIPADQPFGVTDTITCSALEGESRLLLPDSYRVTAELGGVDGSEVELDDVIVEEGATTPAGNVAFEVDPTGALTLRIDTGAGGNCTDAGITGMQLELSRVDGGGGCVEATFEITAGGGNPAESYTTSCAMPTPTGCLDEAQQITATGLASGTYQLAITGIVGGDACWTSRPQFVVPPGGATEDLGVEDLDLDEDNPACVP